MSRLPDKLLVLFKKLCEMLSVNFGWKIFSLLFAVCSWFMVINMTNPKETWQFNINLTLAGVEDLAEFHNVVVRNQTALENTMVSVKIRGNRLDLDALSKRRHEIIASAKLGIIYDFTLRGDVEAPIEIIYPPLPGINPNEAFEITALNPKYAVVTLEEIVTEEKPVRVMLHGDAAEGYVALTPVATPETVKLRGPRSKLNQIDQVLVEMTLSGETGDVSASLPIRLVDRDMQEVKDVNCFTETADVFVRIDKFKKVPVYASYVGEPPEGYAVAGLNWEPKELEIVGSGDEVNNFTQLRLTPVNVSGLTQTNTASFDVRTPSSTLSPLPESVSIRNGSPNNVTVTVIIERVVENQLSMPVSLLGTGTLSPMYSYNILDSTVEITVKGNESLIDGLQEENISLRAELSGYGIGEHLVPVEVSLPRGITLSGEEPAVRVNISEPLRAGPEGDIPDGLNPDGVELEEEAGEAEGITEFQIEDILEE